MEKSILCHPALVKNVFDIVIQLWVVVKQDKQNDTGSSLAVSSLLVPFHVLRQSLAFPSLPIGTFLILSVLEVLLRSAPFLFPDMFRCFIVSGYVVT